MTPPGLVHRPAALGSPGSRALVVGTGRHAPGSLLPDVAAVDETIRELGRTLVERCGLHREHLRSLIDPADPRVLGKALIDVAKEATDVLLLYFVGHGLVSPGNELYLATRTTDDPVTNLAINALPYQAVRDTLSDCRARSIVVVLDCCFAGRARGTFGTAAAHAFELASMGGTYVLTSASADEQALAPVGARYTAFTGELIAFLRDGVPAGPQDLTFEDVYRHLRRVLPTRGTPEPHRHLSDRAGELVLAGNPAARPARPPDTPPPPQPKGHHEPPCPYQGLRSFTADDAAHYFGREKLVGEVLRKLSEWSDSGGPVAVVGPSGAGKSSLLHAGLAPAIRRGELRVEGSLTWPHLSMTPGERPLNTLAKRLAKDVGMPQDAIAMRLRQHPEQLSALIRRALGRQDEDDGRLLLLVDQFEELFTQCIDEDERRAFVKALCQVGVRDGNCPPAAMVVIAVRADFYGRCLTFPELAPTFRDYQVPMVPMTADELRDAIEQPAAVVGCRLEEGLSSLVLRDLRIGGDGHDPTEFGFLPLLSYALEQTWARCEGRDLLIQHYEATGGVWEAVTRQADLVYERLDPDARAAARLLLLRMVHVTADRGDARRRVDLDEIVASRPAGETAHVNAALDALADARLITIAEGTAQIAHESLIHAWPALRKWVDEDRSSLLIYQQLTDAAGLWVSKDRDSAYLYRESRLMAAEAWLAGRGSDFELTQNEVAFVDASVKLRDLERRRRQRFRRLQQGFSILVALAVVAATAAVVENRIAASQRDQAAGNYLLAEANAMGNDPTAAALLILATRLGNKNARNTLVEALQKRAYQDMKITDGGDTVAFDPLHDIYAINGANGTTELLQYDLQHYAPPRPVAVLHGHSAKVTNVAFSANGSVLASGSDGDHSIVLWDNTSKKHQMLATLKFKNPFDTIDTSHAETMAISPDGRLLAVVTSSDTDMGRDALKHHFSLGELTLFDVADPSRPMAVPFPLTREGPGIVAGLEGAVFAPRGHLLATLGTPNNALWELSDPAHPRRVAYLPAAGPCGSIDSAAFTHDGRILVAQCDADYTGGAGRLEVINVSNAAHPTRISDIKIGSGFGAPAISADGRTLVTSRDNEGTDPATDVWDFTDPHRIRLLDTLDSAGVSPSFSLHLSPGEVRRIRNITDLGGDVNDFSDDQLILGGGNAGLWNMDVIREIGTDLIGTACAQYDNPRLLGDDWNTYAPGIDHQQICPSK